jgi:hypothetical protein
MKKPKEPRIRIETEDFDDFVSQVAIRLWNELPKEKFQHLEAKDFADLFASLQKTLKPYTSQGLKPQT